MGYDIDKTFIYLLRESDITGNIFLFTNCEKRKQESYVKLIEDHASSYIHDGLKIVQCSAERFCHELIQSALDRSDNEFLIRFKEADVLILDTFEVLALKEIAQKKIIKIFEEIYNREGIVFLFTRSSCSIIKEFGPEFTRRLEYGSFWINIQ